MSLTALSGVNYDNFTTPAISSSLSDGSDSLIINSDDNKSAFSTLFDSAVKMVNETNDYSNAAEEEEIKYALGESDSIHDLQIAQQKANVSLQYTVAAHERSGWAVRGAEFVVRGHVRKGCAVFVGLALLEPDLHFKPGELLQLLEIPSALRRQV